MKRSNLLSQKQIKEKYGISRIRLWYWRKMGKIKPEVINMYTKNGKSPILFYREEDIIKLLNKKEVKWYYINHK